ncbi:hypothetical protein KBA63_05965 [Candidatus Woesebacteria bacterium]|jgi:hypothetical protein|nr:hypothetical protein [Candidatus Woesebacteria bacterium]MBP9687840.1 hypothetical protein [Candidatus Woesebacteria bacterium]
MKFVGDVSGEYANAIRKGVVALESFWDSLTLIRDFTFLKHVQVVRMKSGNLGITLDRVFGSERVTFILTYGPYGYTLDYVRSRVNPKVFSDNFVLVNARIHVYLQNSSLDQISILERAIGLDTDQVIRRIAIDIEGLLEVTSKKK